MPDPVANVGGVLPKPQVQRAKAATLIAPPSAHPSPVPRFCLRAAGNRKTKVPRRTLRHPSSHLLTLFRWEAGGLLAL